MKKTKEIPAETIDLIATILYPYYIGLQKKDIMDILSILDNSSSEFNISGNWLTREEVKAKYKMSISTIDRLIKAGKIKAKKISPRLVRCDEKSILQILQ